VLDGAADFDHLAAGGAEAVDTPFGLQGEAVLFDEVTGFFRDGAAVDPAERGALFAAEGSNPLLLTPAKTRNMKAKTGTGTFAFFASPPWPAKYQPTPSTTGSSISTRNNLTTRAILPASFETE
jgi:hypothetical protein